ncbi:hypothetical protein NQZ68_009401 [Dissostichus eleginoides]|nr:hypothetical protein NQZ68_009401 [Dissostichus eleginoides]
MEGQVGIVSSWLAALPQHGVPVSFSSARGEQRVYRRHDDHLQAKLNGPHTRQWAIITQHPMSVKPSFAVYLCPIKRALVSLQGFFSCAQTIPYKSSTGHQRILSSSTWVGLLEEQMVHPDL